VQLTIVKAIFYVGFEALAAVTIKNAVFVDVTPRRSSKNLRLGGTYDLHHQCDKDLRASSNQQPKHIMKLHIPEDGILQYLFYVQFRKLQRWKNTVKFGIGNDMNGSFWAVPCAWVGNG
jgi:hypothetical protein